MKRILFICAVLCTTITLFAKEPQRPNSYNYQRGVEAVNNHNDEEGEQFLLQELSENPNNGYAYAWLAGIELRRDETGSAISMLNKAIKYIPKSDKYYHAWAYSSLSKIYYDLNDSTKCIEYADKSIKAEPKNVEWWRYRGILHLEWKNYALASVDFDEMIKLDPTSVSGYMWKGKTYYEMKQYEQALSQYQYASKLATRSFIYSHMAESEIALQRYNEAAEHIICALKEEHFEDLATDLLADANEELTTELMPHLNIQINKNPNSVEWHMYKLYLYRNAKNYEQAIECAEKIKELDANPYFDAIISSLYEQMGDFSSALHYAQLAYQADSTEADYITTLASAYENVDSLQQYLDLMELYVEQLPESSMAYHMRAQYYFHTGNYQSAIDDYTTAITLDAQDTFGRYMRGRAYYILGDTLKANRDLQRVLDDSDNDVETIFALIFLNRHQEARHLADSILNADSIKHENRYNIACSYSLLGEIELAFHTLEQELKDGYVDFNHIRRDIDFSPIRGERLDSLLAIYETKVQERISAFKGEETNLSCNERVVEIPFSKAGGVTKVDCTINELPLSFIFDTGASDVTISQVEANFMYKNGYLSNKDVVGKQRYQTADGSISVGTTIILKEVQFAGLVLKNVRASVVKSQNAPLLLGQSVLQRLGKIEIDNSQRILKITTNQ